MSSLAGKHGPRYRHIADETDPIETIAVEKLTRSSARKSPASISASWSRRRRSNRQIDEITARAGENS